MKHIITSLAALMAIVLLVSACSSRTSGTAHASKLISMDASKPHFTIAPGDLAQAAKISTDVVGPGQKSSVLHLQFSASKAEEVRQFTRQNLNHQIQMLVGSQVVAQPYIRSEISDGQVNITFSSPDEAQAVADALNQK